MIKLIPNLITLANLFCGLLAVIFAVQQDFEAAFIMVVFAAIADFLDGFAARLLNAYSEIGKQLDSLCDLVSFGVAPSLIVYFLGLESTALIIALASAYRLAKFNVDTRQTESFIGLPVPANALLFVSIGYIAQTQPDTLLCHFFTDTINLNVFTILFSFLMVSEIPMFSLKMKGFSVKKYWIIYTFLLLSLISIVIFRVQAIPFIIMVYVSLSILKNNFCPAK